MAFLLPRDRARQTAAADRPRAIVPSCPLAAFLAAWTSSVARPPDRLPSPLPPPSISKQPKPLKLPTINTGRPPPRPPPSIKREQRPGKLRLNPHVPSFSPPRSVHRADELEFLPPRFFAARPSQSIHRHYSKFLGTLTPPSSFPFTLDKPPLLEPAARPNSGEAAPPPCCCPMVKSWTEPLPLSMGP
jgi:hypothetical protein